MLNEFSRTELLIGEEGMEKLKNARVAVFGVGGVIAVNPAPFAKNKSWAVYLGLR